MNYETLKLINEGKDKERRRGTVSIEKLRV